MNSIHVGFIMSTEVGLKTQYLNWRTGLTPDLGVAPEWIEINWFKPGGWVERSPVIPHQLKGRIRSRLELQEGLAHGPFDALFIAATHILHGAQTMLARQPYFLTTDTTVRQIHAFGDLYNKGPSRWPWYEERKHRGYRQRMQNARALFPWSHWAAGSMVDDYGADPARIHVIPPGIDLQKWQMPPRLNRDQPFHILFVGGDFYRKGGDLLLEWAAKTAHKDWVLHLVTRDTVTPPNDKVRVYNNLSPNDPALIALYRDADLFALPTRGDCYSLASMEAMAAGLPVILSLTGGTGDIIKDGETGYLIPAGDGAALVDRLDHLLVRPELCRQMGVAARCDAELRYDVNKNIRQTVSVMRAGLGVPLPEREKVI